MCIYLGCIHTWDYTETLIYKVAGCSLREPLQTEVDWWKRDGREALDALLLSAYFTSPAAEAWRVHQGWDFQITITEMRMVESLKMESVERADRRKPIVVAAYHKPAVHTFTSTQKFTLKLRSVNHRASFLKGHHLPGKTIATFVLRKDF